MKNILTTLLILLSVVGFSQTKTLSTNTTENAYLNGLHKPTDEERQKLSLQLTPSLDFYTDGGKNISFNEVLPLLKSGNYSLDPYINDNNELKAAVLRPSTEEEKKKTKQGQANVNKRSKHVGTSAQPFNVTDISGNTYSLEELKGKIIVMNFWFVECKPCVMEIPDLNKLVEQYKGEEIIFLGFATNNVPTLNSFLSKNEFKYNIIPESRAISNSYGVNAYPTHIIIDQNSKTVFYTVGLGSNTISNIEKEIKSLLKK